MRVSRRARKLSHSRRRAAQRRDRRAAANVAGRHRPRCCSSIARGSSGSSQSRRRSFTSDCSATTSSGSAASRSRRRASRRSRRGTASRRASEIARAVDREAKRLGRHVHARHDPRPAHALGLVLEGRRAVVQLAADRRAAGDPHLRRRARALPSHPSRPLARSSGSSSRARARRTRRSAPGSPSTAPSCSRTACRNAARRSVRSPPWTAGRRSTATARSSTGTRGSARVVGDELLARYHELEPQVAGGAAVAELPRRHARGVCAGSASPTWTRSGGRCPAGRCSRRCRRARARRATRGWKLAILSNTDRDFIEASMASIGVPFELAIVASEIGSYKPAPGHWRAFEERGRAGCRTSMSRASHFHDVVPAIAARDPERVDQPARRARRAARRRASFTTSRRSPETLAELAD